MSLQDFTYVVVAVGVIVFVGFFSYAAHNLVITLKSARDVLDDIKDTTGDIQMVKEGVKLGVVSLVNKLLGSKKGGD